MRGDDELALLSWNSPRIFHRNRHRLHRAPAKRTGDSLHGVSSRSSPVSARDAQSIACRVSPQARRAQFGPSPPLSANSGILGVVHAAGGVERSPASFHPKPAICTLSASLLRSGAPTAQSGAAFRSTGNTRRTADARPQPSPRAAPRNSPARPSASRHLPSRCVRRVRDERVRRRVRDIEPALRRSGTCGPPNPWRDLSTRRRPRATLPPPSAGGAAATRRRSSKVGSRPSQPSLTAVSCPVFAQADGISANSVSVTWQYSRVSRHVQVVIPRNLRRVSSTRPDNFLSASSYASHRLTIPYPSTERSGVRLPPRYAVLPSQAPPPFGLGRRGSHPSPEQRMGEQRNILPTDRSHRDAEFLRRSGRSSDGSFPAVPTQARASPTWRRNWPTKSSPARSR